MLYATLRRHALSLPAVSQEPHHHFASFRVQGRIFVTVPPGEATIHLFVPEPLREPTAVMHPEWAALLRWGGRVVGLDITLAAAPAAAVKRLVHAAWQHKAPPSVRALLAPQGRP